MPSATSSRYLRGREPVAKAFLCNAPAACSNMRLRRQRADHQRLRSPDWTKLHPRDRPASVSAPARRPHGGGRSNNGCTRPAARARPAHSRRRVRPAAGFRSDSRRPVQLLAGDHPVAGAHPVSASTGRITRMQRQLLTPLATSLRAASSPASAARNGQEQEDPEQPVSGDEHREAGAAPGVLAGDDGLRSAGSAFTAKAWVSLAVNGGRW
jgi:hypothetical protein